MSLSRLPGMSNREDEPFRCGLRKSLDEVLMKVLWNVCGSFNGHDQIKLVRGKPRQGGVDPICAVLDNTGK